MTEKVNLAGIVPAALAVRSSKITLEALEIEIDIGFHDFEIGKPQRLLVSIELWLDDHRPPVDDDPAAAWDYDLLRSEVRRIAASRRWNLQETLLHEIYERFAALKGVRALRVRSAKPDIYADAAGVGVEIASFRGATP